MWHSVWHDAPTLNRIALLLACAAIGAFGYAGLRWAAAQPVFAIRGVTVVGEITHADPAYISAVIQQELRGTFFTLDLAAAREALRRVPWLRTVAVRRQWPGRLEITVTEHQPLARWNDSALVDVQGEVFDAEYGEDLPDFEGPDGTAAEVTARYREFSASLAKSGHEIDTLSRSARGAWDARLDDGTSIALGRELVSERWSRWMQLSERYRDRITEGGRIVAVDLRYPNGFAARILRPEKEKSKSVTAGAKAPRSHRG